MKTPTPKAPPAVFLQAAAYIGMNIGQTVDHWNALPKALRQRWMAKERAKRRY